MGCVTQLERGGGGKESIWALNFPPTPQLYQDWVKNGESDVRTDANGQPYVDDKSQIRQQIRDMNSRIQALERQMSFVVEILLKQNLDVEEASGSN
jgi:hypothetical protein